MDWSQEFKKNGWRTIFYTSEARRIASIVDPLRASGLISMVDGKAERGVPDFTDAIREGINDTYTVVTFMVAHELYHLERPFNCLGAGNECDLLRRKHEADADRSAIEILRQLAAQDSTPDHRLGVPTYVFSQLMLTMEGAQGRSSLSPARHPPTHERLRSAALALSDWTMANPTSPSSPSLRALADHALNIVKQIDAETPEKYFAAVDQEASSVTLSSLRVY